MLSNPADDERRPRGAKPPQVPLWAVPVVGIGIAVLSVFITLKVYGTGVGAWLSDFFQSSGLAGLCALGAAFLAFSGIRRQVNVSLRNLEHQREVELKRAWWERFEWAAGRAVPKNREEVKLPYNAVLSTLTGLAETARDEVQQNAVGAITEAAVQAENEALNLERSSGSQSFNRIEALQKYSEAAQNSLAASNAVDAQLYEVQVSEALRRILPADELDLQPRLSAGSGGARFRPDAIIRRDGISIMVEVKYVRSNDRLWVKRLHGVSYGMREIGATHAIIVTPTGKPDEVLGNSALTVVSWSSPSDDNRLLAAVKSVVGSHDH